VSASPIESRSLECAGADRGFSQGHAVPGSEWLDKRRREEPGLDVLRSQRGEAEDASDLLSRRQQVAEAEITALKSEVLVLREEVGLLRHELVRSRDPRERLRGVHEWVLE
jgi:hypothetical protein